MKPSDENQPIILLVLLFVLLIFSAWYAYFYAEGVLSMTLFVSISVIFLELERGIKKGLKQSGQIFWVLNLLFSLC